MDTIVVKETFNADVVMCIDCTNSMSGIIGTIKNHASNFYSDIKRKSIENGKKILSMRIKVIGFRDLSDMQPFKTSAFFTMPEQESAFKSFISNLRADGGGDSPERGYDALSMAMQSNWSTADNTRQVIILWTDAPSHPLSSTSFEELTSSWNSKPNKRLILFAPSYPSWNNLEHKWENTVRRDVNSGGGLTDVDYDEIIKTLSESI